MTFRRGPCLADKGDFLMADPSLYRPKPPQDSAYESFTWSIGAAPIGSP